VVASPVKLMLSLVVATALSSAFLVNDVVVLLFTPMVIQACRIRQVNPVPYLIGEAMASNIGSTATIVGNPQNMLIGVVSGISFARFFAYLAPVAVVSTLLLLAVLWAFYRKELTPPKELARQRAGTGNPAAAHGTAESLEPDLASPEEKSTERVHPQLMVSSDRPDVPTPSPDTPTGRGNRQSTLDKVGASSADFADYVEHPRPSRKAASTESGRRSRFSADKFEPPQRSREKSRSRRTMTEVPLLPPRWGKIPLCHFPSRGKIPLSPSPSRGKSLP
jgi:hypothetical protein